MRETFLLKSDTILAKAHVVNQYLVLSFTVSVQYVSMSHWTHSIIHSLICLYVYWLYIFRLQLISNKRKRIISNPLILLQDKIEKRH